MIKQGCWWILADIYQDNYRNIFIGHCVKYGCRERCQILLEYQPVIKGNEVSLRFKDPDACGEQRMKRSNQPPKSVYICIIFRTECTVARRQLWFFLLPWPRGQLVTKLHLRFRIERNSVFFCELQLMTFSITFEILHSWCHQYRHHDL